MSNAYLDAKHEQYEQLREAIKGLQQRAVDEDRDLTEDELGQVNDKSERARSLYREIEQLAEDEQRASKVAEMRAAVTPGAGDDGGDAPVGPARIMPSQGHVAELLRASAESTNIRFTTRDREPERQRVALNQGDVGIPAQPLSAREPREPRRIATTANMPVETVLGTPDVPYPVFGAGAAGTVAENALKPEYSAVTPGNAAPQVIAAWTDYSKQTQWSMQSFEQRLSNKLARLIAVREDQLLADTVLGTTGIQTYTGATGEAPADSLLHAAGLVLGSDVSAEPDVALLNPGDVIRVFGGSFGANGEQPESALRLELHGMTVYVTGAVAAGTSVVGAWQASSKFVDGRSGVSYVLDALSGLKNNTLTLLAEEAVALAVDEPAGFVNVTFAAPA